MDEAMRTPRMNHAIALTPHYRYYLIDNQAPHTYAYGWFSQTAFEMCGGGTYYSTPTDGENVLVTYVTDKPGDAIKRGYWGDAVYCGPVRVPLYESSLSQQQRG